MKESKRLRPVPENFETKITTTTEHGTLEFSSF
jgi:hypothetical protein